MLLYWGWLCRSWLPNFMFITLMPEGFFFMLPWLRARLFTQQKLCALIFTLYTDATYFPFMATLIVALPLTIRSFVTKIKKTLAPRETWWADWKDFLKKYSLILNCQISGNSSGKKVTIEFRSNFIHWIFIIWKLQFWNKKGGAHTH